MNGSPTYSVASCVMETGQRLRATPFAGDGDQLRRRLGRALLAAEILGFRRVDEQEKRPYRQGLELTLGLYDKALVELIEDHELLLVEELMYSLGGYAQAIQLVALLLDETRPGYLSSTAWPTQRPHEHLDHSIPHMTGKYALPGGPGIASIIARRIRYRLGLDLKQDTPDAFWWSTAQTEEWIARVLDKDELDHLTRRSFNGTIMDWVGHVIQTSINADPVKLAPDDWGAVSLENDPITVMTIGPHSYQASTHADVARTLERAGKQLTVSRVQLPGRESETFLDGYTRMLEQLASETFRPRQRDVVLLYRGGGVRHISDTEPITRGAMTRGSLEAFMAAVETIVGQGSEVVLGIGHGDTAVYKERSRPPIGVHEAVTPSAAAAWVLREHVNHRMIDQVIDIGQSA